MNQIGDTCKEMTLVELAHKRLAGMTDCPQCKVSHPIVGPIGAPVFIQGCSACGYTGKASNIRKMTNVELATNSKDYRQ